MVNQLESFIVTKDEFKDFMKILYFACDMCVDLHVVDRKILQRVDSNTAIIKCDLSSLLQLDGELIFPYISKIVKNLKGLEKNGPIRFKRVGDTLWIMDTISSISISLGLKEFCNNKKIPEAEFSDIFLLGPMFLECEIDKKLCNLVSNYSKLSNQHAVNLNIRTGKVTLSYGSDGSQNIGSEFRVNAKLKDDMLDCKINLPAEIFGLKTAHSLRVYFDEKDGNTNTVAICIFNFYINQNIAFEIYCRSNIIRKQEEK